MSANSVNPLVSKTLSKILLDPPISIPHTHQTPTGDNTFRVTEGTEGPTGDNTPTSYLSPGAFLANRR